MTDDREEIKELEAALAELQDLNDKLRARSAGQQKEINALQTQINALNHAADACDTRHMQKLVDYFAAQEADRLVVLFTLDDLRTLVKNSGDWTTLNPIIAKLFGGNTYVRQEPRTKARAQPAAVAGS